ncbi:Sterile alpha motif type [Echinococcus multilocularis]|uniref:Sterile alpha motif type n=1 Tax=Echinococcus multilocularis TaxID=6211 RepID=A0A068Y6B0_ECHMU|nr:Sterile alpha motif type [Echinococcus multilocularis]
MGKNRRRVNVRNRFSLYSFSAEVRDPEPAASSATRKRSSSTTPRKAQDSRDTPSRSPRTRSRSSIEASKNPRTARAAQVGVKEASGKGREVRKRRRKKASTTNPSRTGNIGEAATQEIAQKDTEIPAQEREPVGVSSTASGTVSEKSSSISSDQEETKARSEVIESSPLDSGSDLPKIGHMPYRGSSLARIATGEVTRTEIESSAVATESAPYRGLTSSSALSKSATTPKSPEEATQSTLYSTSVYRAPTTSGTTTRSQSSLLMPPPRGSVRSWTTEQVAQLLLETPCCAPYAKAFVENEIDGEALALLKYSHFVEPPLNMKVGHAAKFASRVLKLADNQSTTFHPSSFIASFIGRKK